VSRKSTRPASDPENTAGDVILMHPLLLHASPTQTLAARLASC
jgi:hypothetical protein